MPRTKSEYTQRPCKGPHCGCKTGHEKTYDDNGVRCWKCYNCGLLTPIRKRTVRTGKTGLTAAQDKAVELLRKKLLTYYGDEYAAKYEYKTFEVRNTSGFVTVYAIVGRIGDEGTYGAIIGRDTRHVMIGTSGGLKLLNAKDPKQAKGLHNVMYAARSY